MNRSAAFSIFAFYNKGEKTKPIEQLKPVIAIDIDADTGQSAFGSFAHPGTSIIESYLRVEDDVHIRTLCFKPAEETNALPIVLVTGLSTVIESFRGIMQGITAHHPVIYVETREKPSSRVTGTCSFDMDAFSADVCAAVAHHGFVENGYILAGYSLGAAAIMHGYAELHAKPNCVILAEPVPAFRFPSWSMPLVKGAVPLYPVVKPFVKWYMRHFMIDTRKDMEVMRIVERALDSADPVKLRNTVLAISGYQAWDRLERIDRPTLIVATSGDTLHNHDDIQRMSSLLRFSEWVDMEDNTRSHSLEMAEVMRDYFLKIQP